jgi:uncharacterized protein YcnI
MITLLRAAGRHSAVLLSTLALVLIVPALALAHAVVFPKQSATGAYERYTLRVPNEKSVATTRVDIQFPAEVKVTSFTDVPGWQLELVRDSTKRIVGAVWTGTLAPERFVEFPFVAVNPKTASSVRWPTFQTYADGQKVEWTGAEGSKSPASVTTISPAATASGLTSTGSSAFWMSAAALALSVISLGLALRKPLA